MISTKTNRVVAKKLRFQFVVGFSLIRKLEGENGKKSFGSFDVANNGQESIIAVVGVFQVAATANNPICI